MNALRWRAGAARRCTHLACSCTYSSCVTKRSLSAAQEWGTRCGGCRAAKQASQYSACPVTSSRTQWKHLRVAAAPVQQHWVLQRGTSRCSFGCAPRPACASWPALALALGLPASTSAALCAAGGGALPPPGVTSRSPAPRTTPQRSHVSSASCASRLLPSASSACARSRWPRAREGWNATAASATRSACCFCAAASNAAHRVYMSTSLASTAACFIA